MMDEWLQIVLVLFVVWRKSTQLMVTHIYLVYNVQALKIS